MVFKGGRGRQRHIIFDVGRREADAALLYEVKGIAVPVLFKRVLTEESLEIWIVHGGRHARRNDSRRTRDVIVMDHPSRQFASACLATAQPCPGRMRIVLSVEL